MKIILINTIVILSLIGFLLAFYIYKKISNKQKLICPRKTNCDKVVHSKYSKFLGIKIEVLGMIYYFIIGIFYTYFQIIKINFNIYPIIIGLTSISLIFSVYLLLIQAVFIRKWCLWCVSSALISFLIFVLTYFYLNITL